MTSPCIAVYALTHQGLSVAQQLAEGLGADIFAGESLREGCKNGSYSTPHAVTLPITWFARLAEQVAASFMRYDCHIFVAATGIVVRCIAPFITTKDADPAVLVTDQRGRFVISLLSGHLGGANNFAREVAAILGGTAVITTATDVENLPAIDTLAREHGLIIDNLRAVTAVNAALVAGERVDLYDPDNHLGLRDSAEEEYFNIVDFRRVRDSSPGLTATYPGQGRPLVLVTEKTLAGNDRLLILHPPILYAGIGCRRGTSAKAILDHLHTVFTANGLSIHSLTCLASATIKADEPGLAEAAYTLQVPLYFFTPDELRNFPVSASSPKAEEIFGLRGVCEPAALAAAQRSAASVTTMLAGHCPSPMWCLVLPKHAANGVTLAVTRRFYPLPLSI